MITLQCVIQLYPVYAMKMVLPYTDLYVVYTGWQH